MYKFQKVSLMKIFFQTIIALFIINISFAQTNYYVNNSLGTNTPDNGSGSGASAWKTIQYAVDNVANPSVVNIINISSDVYNLLNNQIDINRSFSNLTLLGEGIDNTIIQSAADTSLSNSRVVKVYSGNTVSIKKLTIRYGRFKGSTNSNDGGGGILNSGGTLTIDFCKITENSGKWSEKGIGGGISNYGGNLTIRNSTISHNTGATGGVTGTGAQGGGIGSINGTLNVYNSTISFNYAPLTGGGICVLSDGAYAVFNMENSTVYGNTAKAYAGIRISVFGSQPSSFDVITNINSCTIFNNSAPDYGGIGLTVPSSFNIKNSIVAGNTPTDLACSTFVAITSGGYNIFQTVSGSLTINGNQNNGIGSDPGLLPLADNNTTNGTQTCETELGSPAINAIPGGNGAPLLDQRGAVRNGDYDIGAYEFSPLFVKVNLKVFLQGPYNGSSMNTALITILPPTQPYGGSPWNYNGSENVAIDFFATHTDIVDWVLLELRSDLTTVVTKRAAFLKNDGNIVDVDAVSPLTFNGLNSGNYYVVVRHRNHLAIMSAAAVLLSSASGLYDFTTAQTQAYGTNSMVDLTGGGTVFGMVAGDASNDGQVNVDDRNATWNNKNLVGYRIDDVTLDGQVNVDDRNITWNNKNLGTQIP